MIFWCTYTLTAFEIFELNYIFSPKKHTCMCLHLPQVCRLSVMSCTMSAVRSPILTWHLQSPCAAGLCIMASICLFPVCWSLVWPCWFSCYLRTLGKRFLWVRGVLNTQARIFFAELDQYIGRYKRISDTVYWRICQLITNRKLQYRNSKVGLR